MEDKSGSGKKGRKQRTAELGIVKNLPGCKKGEHRGKRIISERNNSGSAGSGQLGIYDRLTRLHFIHFRCPTWIVHSALKEDSSSGEEGFKMKGSGL